jgi:hypothetical protein
MIRTLFKESVHPITESSYTAEDGVIYSLEEEPHWNSPLGKDICIFDTDNRPFSNEAQPFAPGHFNFEKLKDQSAGVFNHYLYGTSLNAAIVEAELSSAKH